MRVLASLLKSRSDISDGNATDRSLGHPYVLRCKQPVVSLWQRECNGMSNTTAFVQQAYTCRWQFIKLGALQQRRQYAALFDYLC